MPFTATKVVQAFQVSPPSAAAVFTAAFCSFLLSGTATEGSIVAPDWYSRSNSMEYWLPRAALRRVRGRARAAVVSQAPGAGRCLSALSPWLHADSDWVRKGVVRQRRLAAAEGGAGADTSHAWH